MKIIDEKGRLFGMINLIDFLAFLSLLFFALIGYRVWAENKKTEAELKERLLKAKFKEGTLYYKNKPIMVNSPIDLKQTNIRLYQNSHVYSLVNGLRRKADSYRKSMQKYLEESAVMKYIKGLREKLYLAPSEITSIIIVVAVFTNIFVSMLLKKEIRLLGWVVRYLILIIGILGLFKNSASWEKIKKTSFILKYMNNCCKVKNKS